MQTGCLIWKRIVLLYDLPGTCSLCLFPDRAGMKLCEKIIYQLSVSISITYWPREMFRVTSQQFWKDKLRGSKSNFIWSLCHPFHLQWGKEFSAWFPKHVAILVRLLINVTSLLCIKFLKCEQQASYGSLLWVVSSLVYLHILNQNNLCLRRWL